MKPKIQAFVFDVYGTLFDVHSIKTACDDQFPGKGEQISEIWRTKQLDYFFTRHIMGRYADFSVVTREALRYALSATGVTWTPETEDALIAKYTELSPYDEVAGVLNELHAKRTVVLSNGTDAMLTALIHNAGFTDLFEELVSVDGVKQAKPSPAAYMHWFKNSGLERDEVLFLSSNGWDIAGAKNFGFHTAWINRDGKPLDMPDLTPDAVYEDLSGILEWVTDEAAWP
ncbi:haloacid dehalogenase type II [Exiguobacterium aurantiacum]|uniref:Haloacetate dehalogenase H-2 n=1 Tax=Exiguobacterium aurantiacum TaxID=33987 RepID=A0A377FQU6_9BACL|nr:haloacid dehalogenase type II [Exiguobacterium aurantiacum]STO07201.1 Haloacetate dehalogenase H-2 [Exiguobacterium aurantiacum]